MCDDRSGDVHCIMPPAPDLLDKIVRSKARFLAGKGLPSRATASVLDARTYTLILARPPRTRAHTFSAAPSAAPVTGNRRALVLLVDFSDKAAGTAQSHYEDMLFSVGSYATGSMRDFFLEASYNQLDVSGKVFGTGGPTAGWFRAPKTKAHYTDGNYGFNAYPKNAQKLVEDVIDLAAPHVDFSDYDNGTGKVEALVIIAAGSGGEATGNTGDIWSHKWGISPQTRNGVTIDSYFMAPEDGRVGVMSHELGHLLMKWPDLYDTDYSSAGTGKWDLMAGGSWNGSPAGDTPAHPTAWCKARVGWVNPTTVLNAAQSVTLKPYATDPDVYKLPMGSASSKEYFLVSNRQKAKFDRDLPGEGCIIEHIDDNKTNNTDENHYLVDIEQCDGQRHLNKNQNRGDSNDAFPCGSNADFTAATTPHSKAYDGTDHKISVKNITRSGDLIQADLENNPPAVSGPAWHHDLAANATFADHSSEWAWVHIDTLGWRRIKEGAPDGVTNMFAAFCAAVASGRKVSVYADADLVYTMYLL